MERRRGAIGSDVVADSRLRWERRRIDPLFSAETLGYPGALDDGNAYGIVEMPGDYIYAILGRQGNYLTSDCRLNPGGALRIGRRATCW